ncbi:MAG: serine/threonine-protein phosphatase [Anaerolineae bacterium]|nr:serine/threonine-protein phosphatase [Phycisphaerae bacterium]
MSEIDSLISSAPILIAPAIAQAEQNSTLTTTAPPPTVAPASPLTRPAAVIEATGDAMDLVAPIERQIESLQSEISGLQEEVNVLRRRDETLKFYMHRVDEEMRLAARLQQDFLPKVLPQLGRVHFHTIFRPAGYVSGDLYDVMRLDENHVGFYMADAVGHGMPAALLTMFIKNALHTKQITADGYRLVNPSETMARLNDVLVSQQLSHATFATAIYGLINTQTFEVTFARGGHPCPLLLRANGEIENLEADGSLLGIFENEKFSDRIVQLASGDRMFIFTDGVEVAFDEGAIANPEQWREEIYKRRHLTTEDLMSELVKALDLGPGSLQPKDDLTVIAVEVR